jgi:hypothetical protein
MDETRGLPRFLLRQYPKEERAMTLLQARQVAQDMMRRHGLAAQAVVEELVNEARLSGNAQALDDWEQIQTMIAELRREAASQQASSASR